MMRLLTNSLFSSMAMALAIMGACDIESGGNLEGFRRIEGELLLPDSGIIGRQNTGLEIAAISVSGTGAAEAFASNTFDPAIRTGEASFVLYSPDDVSVFLVLQVPGAGDAGEFLGLLDFSDGRGGTTSIVPRGTESIDLGVLRAIENAPETVLDNRLAVDTGSNPLGQVDSDDDGQSDLIDADDDGDGIDDAQDTDVAGDGVEDAVQTFESLADEDEDGIPDLLDT